MGQKIIFASIMLLVPGFAEFRYIEMGVSGLDCASCAASVEKTLRRLKGVESAEFRMPQSVAVVRLKADNTVSLDEVRDALKRVGYTPTEAKVSARGRVLSAQGKWRLRMAGLDREYLLEGTSSLRENDAVLVEGSIAPSSDRAAPEVLKISAIRTHAE